MEARPENKIVWPVLAATSLFIACQNHRRLRWPPHILWLGAYLLFAGASVLWAYSPWLSFIRYSQQVMVITAIVLPAVLAARSTDMMRALFFCFAVAIVINAFFLLGRPPIDEKFATWGHTGYFSGKNYLGQCAAMTVLLASHEMLSPGKRRMIGIVIGIIALGLLLASNSRTSLGLTLLAPALAGATLMVRKTTRLSVALILLSIPVCYIALSGITGFSMNRLSYMLYGDSTFTGRTIIWEFANSEIARRPFLGWGYQSFWLVGPDAPSVVDAPGWIKDMPNAHNGYKDTMLELGYVGLALLLGTVIATLHAIGRIADRDMPRAWLLLSLALFIIITNGLESLWMRAFEMVWVVFLILVAETARQLPNSQTGVSGYAFSKLGRKEPSTALKTRRSQPSLTAYSRSRAR
jgi:O-antigen ligase